MSHHHHHESHAHHHDHEHHHHTPSEMSFPEKLRTLFNHWIAHNLDHAKTYADWAEKADKEGLTAVGKELRAAAEAAREVNLRIETALGRINR